MTSILRPFTRVNLYLYNIILYRSSSTFCLKIFNYSKVKPGLREKENEACPSSLKTSPHFSAVKKINGEIRSD